MSTMLAPTGVVQLPLLHLELQTGRCLCQMWIQSSWTLGTSHTPDVTC